LVAQSETPLVIANVMRSGPSTGMPTKQEQGDLNMMLYGGHGEIPRFVLTPTSIADTFHKTVEAFNLAEKYQTPVYLSIDLAMSVTEQTIDPDEFDVDDIEIDRGKLVDEDEVEEWQDDQGRFQPHLATEDGISPRTIPGTEGGVHMSTGLEHNALGRRTEDVDDRVEQVDKRERKVETAREREDFSASEFGDPDADTLVIGWGSTEGAMVEALEFLEEDGIDVRYLSVPYIFPRPDLSEAVEEAETVIVAEANATGQFADVVEHDVLERVERINKYTGVQFKADELADEIRAIVGETTEVTA
jgi:2-oxoglutarate ferredoxin oxidoreductase subunit alpha